MITSAATTPKKTIFKETYNKNFAVLGNETLRMQIEGDPLTAKDIWLDALTCKDDYLFTTPNIAKRFNIHPKKAQRLCTRLCKAGLAERQQVRDPEDQKILMNFYLFFEKPVDKKCPVGDINKSLKLKEIPKPPSGQKVSTISIKKNYKKNQSEPPPEIGPRNDLKFNPAEKELAIADGLKKLRAKLPPDTNQNLSKTFLTMAIIKHGIQYLLWLANECSDKYNPLKYFCKGVHNRESMNKYDRVIVRDGEAGAVRESEEHKKDIDAMVKAIGSISDDRQYQKKETSAQALPAKPPEKPAYKREKTSFLRAKLEFLSYVEDLGLRDHFEKQNDSRLAQGSEFVRFCSEKGFKVDD